VQNVFSEVLYPRSRIAPPLCEIEEWPILRPVAYRQERENGAVNRDTLWRYPRRGCWHKPIRESPDSRGGSRKVSDQSSYLHTPAKKSTPVSRIQAYIA
jgi:hypothetical protein